MYNFGQRAARKMPRVRARDSSSERNAGGKGQSKCHHFTGRVGRGTVPGREPQTGSCQTTREEEEEEDGEEGMYGLLSN